MMSLRQIEVFRAIMVAGSVHGAAAILHVSQPGLSRLIKHVEDRLGVVLFERRKGRLVPTAEAKSLFEDIEPIYRQIEQMKAATQRIGRGEGQTLKIAASPSVGRYIIPHALSLMTADGHKVPVQLDVLSTDQVVDYLTWRIGEAVVTIFPVDHPSVVSRPIGSGDLICAVPKDHPLGTRPSIDARDLASYDLIGFELATPHGAAIASMLRRAGLEYRPGTIVRFAETACALVEFGLGVSVVDEFTTTGNVYPRLTVKRFGHSVAMNMYLNTNSVVASSVMLRKFEAALSKTVTMFGLETGKS